MLLGELLVVEEHLWAIAPGDWIPPGEPSAPDEGHPLPDAPAPDPEAVRIIKQLLEEPEFLRTFFQPVVSLAEGRVIGYEALTRGPSGTVLESPRVLFSLARRAGLLLELDRLSRLLAVRRAAGLVPPDDLLFLNVASVAPLLRVTVTPPAGATPSTPGMAAAEAGAPAACPRDALYLDELKAELRHPAVLELSEEDPSLRDPLLAPILPALRAKGWQFSLDDFGVAFSGLASLVELQPEWLKLDRVLVKGLASDPRRRRFLATLVEGARRAGINVVAEQVETLDELAVLLAENVAFAQGYVLAPPAPVPPSLSPEAMELLTKYQRP
ncbi:MAG TPA: EAL domain-containing protein [Firmicutes bacterium]|nr:EAL domain-containing protein [Bacillota bacterium]